MKISVVPHDTCRLAVVIMIGFTRDLQDSSFVAIEIFLFVLDNKSNERWTHRISKQKRASSTFLDPWG